jgi:hypothetical protein
MIRRLYELRQHGRDADAWLWGLWLDPADYPVEIGPWILRRLNDAQTAIDKIGDDPDKIESHLAEELKRGRLARKLYRRGVSQSRLRDLMLWAYRVAADIEQQQRLDNPDSAILDTLRKIGGLPERGFPAPDQKLGVELMSIAWLREVAERASPDEREQVRRDCRAIKRLAELAARINWRAAQPALESVNRSILGGLPKPPSVLARKEARRRPPVPDVVRFLKFSWEEPKFLAILACALLAFRKSPEHGKRITEILALATWMLELGVRAAPAPLAPGKES